jgi:hypothetical protein
MPDQRIAYSRMAPATLCRIVALGLPRSHHYALRPIAAPGLAAGVPDKHATRRPGI